MDSSFFSISFSKALLTLIVSCNFYKLSSKFLFNWVLFWCPVQFIALSSSIWSATSTLLSRLFSTVILVAVSVLSFNVESFCRIESSGKLSMDLLSGSWVFFLIVLTDCWDFDWSKFYLSCVSRPGRLSFLPMCLGDPETDRLLAWSSPSEPARYRLPADNTEATSLHSKAIPILLNSTRLTCDLASFSIHILVLCIS